MEQKTQAADQATQHAPEERDAGEGDPADALTRELAEARQAAAESHDRYLRVYAEMDNYKKRIERTYADLSRNSKKELLLKLLGVKDNLERALSYGSNDGQDATESVIQGVRLTEYQLDSLLRAEGVTPVELTGKAFDPQQAEAVGTVVDPSVPDHTIVQETQRGYTYGDHILRPAKVVVAVQEPAEDA